MVIFYNIPVCKAMSLFFYLNNYRVQSSKILNNNYTKKCTLFLIEKKII